MKPSDFDYLKVIGKGSFGKVLLARHRKHGGYYAVKVLQKQTIVKRKEVIYPSIFLSVYLSIYLSIYLSADCICCVSVAEACDGREERTAEGSTTSIPGGAPLLFPDTKHALLRPGLC